MTSPRPGDLLRTEAGRGADALDQILALQADLAGALSDLHSAQAERDAALSDLTAAQAQVAELTAQVAALQQQLADSQAGADTPPPDPPIDPPPPNSDPLDPGGVGTTPGAEYPMTIAGCIDLGAEKTSAAVSWDQAFDAAIAKAKAKKASTGVAPPILFPAGERVALSGTRVVYDGMCLIGFGIGSIQRSANSIQTDVRWSGTGSMFVLDHTTFDVTIIGLSFQSNDGGTFFDGKGFVLWESTFRDVAQNGWRHSWWGTGGKLLNTLCTWDGRHNYNNMRGQPWGLGGSDSPVMCSRLAMDVGGNAGYKAEFANPANGNGFELSLNSQQKAAVSGLYITCEGQASGVLIANGTGDHMDSIDKSIIEGRNAGAPCLRELLRVTGGRVRVTDTLLNYANKPVADPANPAASQHGAPIVVMGGQVSMEACDHNRASGVAASKPVVYVANGAKFRGYGCSSGDGQPWVVAAEENADVQTDGTFIVNRV